MGVQAVSNADNGNADWDQEEEGVEDDAMKSEEDVKVWENGDPDEEQYPFGLLDENETDETCDGDVGKERWHGLCSELIWLKPSC